MNRLMLPAVLGAAAVVATACGAGGGLYGGGPPSSAPTTAAAGVAVSVGNSSLGPLLVDANGRTLYLFEADTSGSSTCYSLCAQAWPPLLTHGAPNAGAGIAARELGTVRRTDGTTEVTYNGHPLYYYVGDAHPGDTTGQALNQFGAEWYAVGAGGSKIA